MEVGCYGCVNINQYCLKLNQSKFTTPMRKTRLLTLLLPFCGLSMGTAAPGAIGDTLQIGNWQFEYELAKNGITLTRVVTEGEGRLVIPSTCTLNGATKEIVAISKDFLHGHDGLTSLTLPATLTDLGATETEPMFDVHYRGAGTSQSPLATPLRSMVRGHSTWRMTVGCIDCTVDNLWRCICRLKRNI